MKELSNTIDNDELISHYIINNAQFRVLSHELFTSYQQLDNVINTYDDQLNKHLILARRLDLKHFFAETNTLLRYMTNIFKSVQDDKIRLFIINKINKHRQMNIDIARKYL